MMENIELDEVIFKESSPEENHANEFRVIESTVSYSAFMKNFLRKNQACLIKNVANSWKATELWVAGELPNFSYLQQHFGETQVSVQNCQDVSYAKTCTQWKFKEYLQYWEDGIKCGYPHKQLFYLKDWHLKNDFPSYDFYEVPIYFASDWLNEYLVENSLDDYRFVYMGIKGTWSPLHVDVMTSYSWSSNVCGQKRWLLFPPGEENCLKNHLGKLPDDITNLNKDCCKCFDVIQQPGDIIFVPSNWYHQVWNLKDTISINHNWINACNLLNVWHALEKSLSEVIEEIRDCTDMENFLDHCQLMLQALFGMDFIKFYDFICYIACKRINLLQKNVQICLSGNRRLGKTHALSDLCSIKNTLTLYLQHEIVPKLKSLLYLKIPPKTLLNNIENVISTHNPYVL